MCPEDDSHFLKRGGLTSHVMTLGDGRLVCMACGLASLLIGESF